jgi:hypothetical protein
VALEIGSHGPPDERLPVSLEIDVQPSDIITISVSNEDYCYRHFRAAFVFEA